MSDFEAILEKNTEDVDNLIECMEMTLKTAFNNLESVDTHEMYEAIDIYKDLTEAKKNIIKSCYYKQIMKAMENSEYGVDYKVNPMMP